MTDRDALLRAICDTPEDDAPRLIYADWLDENGDPRQAAFIREHIAVNHIPSWDLGRRPEGTHLMVLWRDLRKWRYVTGDWWAFSLNSFVRGFNTHWRGSVPEFLQLVPTPWRFGPLVTLTLDFDVHPGGREALAATVAGLANLSHVAEVQLGFGTHLTDEWATALRGARPSVR